MIFVIVGVGVIALAGGYLLGARTATAAKTKLDAVRIEAQNASNHYQAEVRAFGDRVKKLL